MFFRFEFLHQLPAVSERWHLLEFRPRKLHVLLSLTVLWQELRTTSGRLQRCALPEFRKMFSESASTEFGGTYSLRREALVVDVTGLILVEIILYHVRQRLLGFPRIICVSVFVEPTSSRRDHIRPDEILSHQTPPDQTLLTPPPPTPTDPTRPVKFLTWPHFVHSLCNFFKAQ